MQAYNLEDRAPWSAEQLQAEGIFNQRLPTEAAAYAAPIAELCRRHGYVQQDVVELSAATPELETLQSNFWAEHFHDEDEVRFVLAGAGVFDIRSCGDAWLRIEVFAGDLIVVPAGRFHRFALTEASQIRCLRLFQRTSGWQPHYRTVNLRGVQKADTLHTVDFEG